MFSSSMLHILGRCPAVTLWPTFVLSQDIDQTAQDPGRTDDIQDIQARANANPIPSLEGYNVMVEKNPQWQAILVNYLVVRYNHHITAHSLMVPVTITMTCIN